MHKKKVVTWLVFWKWKPWRYGFLLLWYCFSVRCYSFFRLTICCENIILILYMLVCNEISYRMLEERSTNPNRRPYWNPGRYMYVRGMTNFDDYHQISKLICKEAKVWLFCVHTLSVKSMFYSMLFQYCLGYIGHMTICHMLGASDFLIEYSRTFSNQSHDILFNVKLRTRITRIFCVGLCCSALINYSTYSYGL